MTDEREIVEQVEALLQLMEKYRVDELCIGDEIKIKKSKHDPAPMPQPKELTLEEIKKQADQDDFALESPKHNFI